MPSHTLLPPHVRTFPGLIRWIADEYHDGAVWRIAPQIGVSVPLVNQWVHGIIKSPQTKNLIALPDRYGIDFADVIRAVRGHTISGGSAGNPTLAVAARPRVMSLIRHWLRRYGRAGFSSGTPLALAL